MTIAWNILQIMRDRHSSFFVEANCVFALWDGIFRVFAKKFSRLWDGQSLI
jgi:hypothetical protein